MGREHNTATPNFVAVYVKTHECETKMKNVWASGAPPSGGAVVDHKIIFYRRFGRSTTNGMDTGRGIEISPGCSSFRWVLIINRLLS